MPSRKPFRRDEPASLRTGGSAPVFTDRQLLVVAVFVSALAQGGYGAYCKLSADGTSLRIKIYGDDETWQDNLGNQENLELLFDGFAHQLKVQPIFRGLMAELHGPGPAEAPERPPETPKGLRSGKG